jgi:hypothetical protein
VGCGVVVWWCGGVVWGCVGLCGVVWGVGLSFSLLSALDAKVFVRTSQFIELEGVRSKMD